VACEYPGAGCPAAVAVGFGALFAGALFPDAQAERGTDATTLNRRNHDRIAFGKTSIDPTIRFLRTAIEAKTLTLAASGHMSARLSRGSGRNARPRGY
jgi:hypothetical protein